MVQRPVLKPLNSQTVSPDPVQAPDSRTKPSQVSSHLMNRRSTALVGPMVNAALQATTEARGVACKRRPLSQYARPRERIPATCTRSGRDCACLEELTPHAREEPRVSPARVGPDANDPASGVACRAIGRRDAEEAVHARPLTCIGAHTLLTGEIWKMPTVDNLPAGG